MCDARGSEPGLAGAPCFALSVLVRQRYPDASVQLVSDFENAIAKMVNDDRRLNTVWFLNPLAAVEMAWRTITR